VDADVDGKRAVVAAERVEERGRGVDSRLGIGADEQHRVADGLYRSQTQTTTDLHRLECEALEEGRGHGIATRLGK
jgi:hypothetical protein